MELQREHLLLLQALRDIGGGSSDQYVGCEAAGLRLRDLLKAGGGGYSWTDGGGPWHGTRPWGQQLVDAGLLVRDVGVASYRPHGSATPTVGEYFLALTDAGRDALQELAQE